MADKMPYKNALGKTCSKGRREKEDWASRETIGGMDGRRILQLGGGNLGGKRKVEKRKSYWNKQQHINRKGGGIAPIVIGVKETISMIRKGLEKRKEQAEE